MINSPELCIFLNFIGKVCRVSAASGDPSDLIFPARINPTVINPFTVKIIIMATVIPSFLLPRGPAIRGHRTQVLRQVPLVRHSPSCHYASASPSKPRNLEKPTKFRPPSHGQRLKEHVPRQYGPELTKEQKTEQKTKQYPRMMPPEGSFMFWFLTNQTIHLVITLVRCCGHHPTFCASDNANRFSREPSLSWPLSQPSKIGNETAISNPASQKRPTFSDIPSNPSLNLYSPGG